jgi:hypothetical protein
MKNLIEQRIQELSNEIQSLAQEREAMKARDEEIEVRMHQLVGAIFELQNLINLENQPSEPIDQA